MKFHLFLDRCPFLTPPFTCKPLSGGNMNELLLVRDALGYELVLKYAPPYLHMLGPDFPLGQERIHIEMHALAYFGAIAPHLVPRVLHKDEAAFMMALVYKKGFITLREAHMQGQFTPEIYSKLGKFIGTLCTNIPPAKPLHFYENPVLKSITNTYVFTIAFMKHSDKTNPHKWFTPLPHSPQLLANVAFLKTLFNTSHTCLIHGDLHTGSVLVNEHDIAVIDAEFALFGPPSFDIGNVMAHLVMDSAGLAFPLGAALETFWQSVVQHAALTQEEQGEMLSQSIGFCGVEIARRLVVPAKSPALESLKNRQEVYGQMDALSHRLIENFRHMKTLQDFFRALP